MTKEKIDFNDYAEKYDHMLGEQLGFFDESNAYFAEYKVIKAKNYFQTHPKHILDFGCGIGRSTFYLQKHFPLSHLYGCDISENSLIEARKKFPNIHFCQWEELTKLNIRFDFIFLACVLHHVPPENRRTLIELLVSIANKNGTFIIFEHNPFNPVTRHLVNTCPFDRDAVLLKPKELKSLLVDSGLKEIQCQYTLFFPAILKWMRPIERYLHALPLGGQYLVRAINY